LPRAKAKAATSAKTLACTGYVLDRFIRQEGTLGLNLDANTRHQTGS
jgi:hypothetical protein